MSSKVATIAKAVPKVIFIVPYRNRPQHKFFFSNYLTSVLKGSEIDLNYEIYFSHQCDARSFNRGATKNIGFIAVKEKYPDDYQGQFIYKEFWSTPEGTKEEMIYFKVYEVDVALPTKEQKRDDNIDELLQ